MYLCIYYPNPTTLTYRRLVDAKNEEEAKAWVADNVTNAWDEMGVVLVEVSKEVKLDVKTLTALRTSHETAKRKLLYLTLKEEFEPTCTVTAAPLHT